VAKRLAIVGSGTGGTFAANLLANRLKDNVRRGEAQVTLFGEGFRHHFQPGNLDIAFKGEAPDAYSKSELDLLRKEVTFIPDPARRVDLENRKIETVGGTKFEYDELLMATGAEAAPDMIPGLSEASVNFHTGPLGAQKVWTSIRGFKKGKIGVVIAGVPHKCPPSPDEALFLMDEYFRHKGVREDVELTLLTPYPRPYPADKISQVVLPLFDSKGIKTVPFFNLDSVDPEAKKAYSLEGDEFEYDILVAVPPHRGARVVRESGFGDGEGWIPTDKKTMRIKGRDDAYAIGDATDIPISKSGVVAHLQSKAVALTMISEIEGTALDYEYNGRINCPMEVGDRRAIFVSATYESPPTDQAPSMIKYAMKRGFGALYWSALSGRWEWMMDAYFGPTYREVPRVKAVATPQA
jgi:sulfide:quinone oxidoreductase